MCLEYCEYDLNGILDSPEIKLTMVRRYSSSSPCVSLQALWTLFFNSPLPWLFPVCGVFAATRSCVYVPTAVGACVAPPAPRAAS